MRSVALRAAGRAAATPAGRRACRRGRAARRRSPPSPPARRGSRSRASISSSAKGSSPSSSPASSRNASAVAGRLVVVLDRRRLAVAGHALVPELDVHHLRLVRGSARDHERLRHPYGRDRASSSTADTLERGDADAGDLPAELDPHLPRAVWLVQAGGVVNALGNGIVFPFAIIYLHNVRGSRSRRRIRPGDRRGLGAGGGPDRGATRGSHRRPQHARLRPDPAARRVHALPADQGGLACVRVVRAGRRGDGLLLARAVDAARTADAAGSPALGLRASTREREPRHRARRRDRWTDRHHRRSGSFTRIFSSTRRPFSSSRSCSSSVSGAARDRVREA